MIARKELDAAYFRAPEMGVASLLEAAGQLGTSWDLADSSEALGTAVGRRLVEAEQHREESLGFLASRWGQGRRLEEAEIQPGPDRQRAHCT